MVSQLSMTYKLVTLQIVLLVLGGFTAVAAVVGAIAALMYLSVQALRLISDFYLEATRLLSSMPALQFLFLLAIACSVTVLAVKMLAWAVRSIRAEVRYAAK
jgi:hypothetical protein